VVNVLVEPLKREFSLSDTQVSLLGFAFAILNIVVGIAVARVAERKRRVTLISAGAILWSVATAACGLAASWVQLLVARIAVGVGEGIGLPGNQSVIADYYPPHRRGTAMSVLLLAPPIGAFIGFVGGGLVAQSLGWRWTFAIAAVPGVIFGIIAWLFVAEPQRGQHDRECSAEVPGLGAVLRRFASLPGTRQLVIGSALASALGFGLNYFFTALMMRKFGLPIGEAGLYAGLIASLPAAISIVTCGWLGDRFGTRFPAAYALIPGLCMIVAAPLYALAVTRESLPLLLGLVSLSALLQFGYLGITFATIQNTMHPRMRATASALLNSIYGVAGGVGPLVLGMLSDRLAQSYDPGQALAYAMAGGGLGYLWAALHYLLAARHIGPDLVKARSGQA
jgi:MFS family permease